jgi:hypothetical protein
MAHAQRMFCNCAAGAELLLPLRERLAGGKPNKNLLDLI